MIATMARQDPCHTHGIIGTSPAIRRALALAERFATSGLPILLVGPTGSGKELFARAIHVWSRRPGRLVDVNCGALPRDLVEGELFGHAKGAFTGAVSDQSGLLASAAGGTLFLDEVTSLTMEAQVKLLRALETGKVRRLGESVDRKVDFHLIAAAQPDIHTMLQAGSFRLDLFQRIAGLVIPLPGLSERGEDIVVLARSFATANGRCLDPTAEQSLLTYSWPGNVRELRSAIDRACLVSQELQLGRRVVEEAVGLGLVGGQEATRPTSPQVPEGQLLDRLCALYGWQSGPIAVALGVSRATLFRMLRVRGISLRRGNEGARVRLGWR